MSTIYFKSLLSIHNPSLYTITGLSYYLTIIHPFLYFLIVASNQEEGSTETYRKYIDKYIEKNKERFSSFYNTGFKNIDNFFQEKHINNLFESVDAGKKRLDRIRYFFEYFIITLKDKLQPHDRVIQLEEETQTLYNKTIGILDKMYDLPESSMDDLIREMESLQDSATNIKGNVDTFSKGAHSNSITTIELSNLLDNIIHISSNSKKLVKIIRMVQQLEDDIDTELIDHRNKNQKLILLEYLFTNIRLSSFDTDEKIKEIVNKRIASYNSLVNQLNTIDKEKKHKKLMKELMAHFKDQMPLDAADPPRWRRI